MTVAEKRKVVEVLLCGTDFCGPNIEQMEPWFDAVTRARAVCLQSAIVAEMPLAYADIEFDTCEAAYRLIESSPTLRREWFGVP